MQRQKCTPLGLRAVAWLNGLAFSLVVVVLQIVAAFGTARLYGPEASYSAFIVCTSPSVPIVLAAGTFMGIRVERRISSPWSLQRRLAWMWALQLLIAMLLAGGSFLVAQTGVVF